MIKRNSVLVLGAGASVPFLFPSGQQLSANIMKELEPNLGMYNLLKNRFLFNEKKIIDFRKSFLRSGTSSIDEFLEHRTEFIDIGKVTIAEYLLRYEMSQRLFDDWWASKMKETNNWYQYLFKRMDASFEKFQNNNIRIITFNYDRSLEHYFCTCLMNKYNKSEKECAKVIEQIPILHIYGSLGRLPWQSDIRKKVVPYDVCTLQLDQRIEYITRASEGIRIISEDCNTDTEEIKQAHEWLINSEQTLFLGFGFNRTNTARLIPTQIRMDGNFAGTIYGLPYNYLSGVIGELGIKTIKLDWRGEANSRTHQFPPKVKIDEFLRENMHGRLE